MADHPVQEDRFSPDHRSGSADPARAPDEGCASAGAQERTAPASPRSVDDDLLPPFTEDPLSDAVISRRRRARLLGAADPTMANQEERRDGTAGPARWRRLLRVAGIYIVVTAFILQFASVALPALLVPDWVLTLVVVIAGAGFPVAMAAANWLIGARRGRRPVDRVVDGVVLAALLLVGAGVYLLANDRFVAPNRAQVSAAAAVDGIAVLPFATPGLTDGAYLGEGLPDAIVSGLANIPGLRVPPVSSTFGLAQTDSMNVADALAVRYVLEGSIRQAANGLVITLRIWDAVDEQPRLGWTLERPREDIFGAINTIVLEVARVITDGTDPDLLATAVTSQRTTRNEDAYLAYLEGRTLWKRRDEGSVREAIRRFDRAVSLDPGFARAHANLASTWLHLGIYGLEAPVLAMANAERFAEQALAAGTDIGEAYAVLGMLKLLRWDWSGGEDRFRRALAAEPNEPLGHHWYSTFLGEVGRLDASLAQAQRLQEIDPLSPAVSNRLAWAYLALGRYDDARGWFARAREGGIRQGFFAGYAEYLIAANSGRPEAGIRAFRRTLVDSGADATWLDAFARARETDADAESIRLAVVALRASFAMEDVAQRQRLLFLSVLLPEPALALEVLEHMRARDRGLLGVTLWLADASALRRAADFPALTRRLGLDDYWREHACAYDGRQYRCGGAGRGTRGSPPTASSLPPEPGTPPRTAASPPSRSAPGLPPLPAAAPARPERR